MNVKLADVYVVAISHCRQAFLRTDKKTQNYNVPFINGCPRRLMLLPAPIIFFCY